MPMPRLMPLVAIAAVGVLAINALENGPGIVGAARSFAEGVAKKPPADPAKPAAGVFPANASPITAQAAAPICAESTAQIAKEAGISPAELQVIQSLGVRRGQLDQREQGLSTELALVQAAEAKVDARIATMNALKADMQTLLGQLDDKQQAEVDRLVKVYEAMKPQAAADRFVLLTDDVRLPIAAKMKPLKLSAMIAAMPPPEAKRLTESIAARYVAQAAAARQAINPPQAQAQPPATPPAPKPAQAAQATPPAAAATPAAPLAAAAVAPTPDKPKPAARRKPKAAAKPAAKALAAAPPPVVPTWPPAPKPGAPAASPAAAKAAAPPPAAIKTAAGSPPPAKAAATTSAAKPATTAPTVAPPSAAKSG
jgi:flagellar motility protein MotE (MotC chaperone)